VTARTQRYVRRIGTFFTLQPNFVKISLKHVTSMPLLGMSTGNFCFQKVLVESEELAYTLSDKLPNKCATNATDHCRQQLQGWQWLWKFDLHCIYGASYPLAATQET